MRPLSIRIQQIRPSGIRRIFDLACANPDGIDLSIGDPDYDVPVLVKEEAMSAIKNGMNGYVSTRGIEELRRGIVQKLKSSNLYFEDVLVTSGATGGYYLSMLTLLSSGDEVLIVDPYFVAYANVVIMCGGTPKFIDTYPDFHLREEAIVPLISAKTKAIVINNPNNPTGILYSREELQLVADIAEKYGLYIISDEIYDQFVFSPDCFVSLGQLSKNAIVISGFSKTMGMTGWRLGYVSASHEIIDAMATFQQYSYVCANSVAQYAAIKALSTDISSNVAEYKQRRDLVYDGLKELFVMRKPEGAFYVFPEAPGGDAEKFVNMAIEQNVFIIPGSVFSLKNSHFRISIAADKSKLGRAVEILNRIAKSID